MQGCDVTNHTLAEEVRKQVPDAVCLVVKAQGVFKVDSASRDADGDKMMEADRFGEVGCIFLARSDSFLLILCSGSAEQDQHQQIYCSD